MVANLLPGWRRFQTPDGREYFHNAATNETTWTAPVDTTAPSPAGYPPSATPAPAPLPTPAPAKALVPTTAAAPLPGMALGSGDGRYTMATLVANTGQRTTGAGFFELERDKLLEINLTPGNNFAWMKNGAMVARRGDVKFTRQGLKEQGIGKYMKKAVTGEGMKLVKCQGLGKVFCADFGKNVSVVELRGEALSVNGNDVLAFSGSLQYDIKFIKSAGMLAGGLFNVKIWGQGMLAFTCHGSVVTLQASPQDPVFTDPNATVAWTHDPDLKTDLSMKAFIGKGTGEEFQLKFSQGFVIIQPYEEIAASSGGGGGSAGMGAFGDVLGALG